MIPRLISAAEHPGAYCDQCGCSGIDVILVGEPEKWDSRTAALCRACLTKATLLFPPHVIPSGSPDV